MTSPTVITTSKNQRITENTVDQILRRVVLLFAGFSKKGISGLGCNDNEEIEEDEREEDIMMNDESDVYVV